MSQHLKSALPTRALGLLLLIGVFDMVTTAWLHSHGLIAEMNPLMRVLIERSELLFILVKGGTLVVAWYLMVQYSKSHLEFVRTSCLLGSVVYGGVWLTWFLLGRR